MGKHALWKTLPPMLMGLFYLTSPSGCGPNAGQVSGSRATPSSAAGAARRTTAETTNTPRPARWVLMPNRASVGNQHNESASREWRVIDGVRVRYDRTSAPTASQDFLPGSSVQSLDLPAAMGGGYLFHSDVDAETVFWNAETWTAPATPLARLPERADQIDIGFGRVYARLADSGETVAFDPKTGKNVTLGPLPPSPSYFDFQFWDDWFAVVHTDARGVLATFDGGMTWHATGITAEDASLSLDPDGIVISTGERRDLLAPDGTWTPEYESSVDETAHVPEAHSSPLGSDPLELAVLHGVATNTELVAVANWGHVGLVDVDSGELVDVELDQYPGSLPCHGVAFGKTSDRAATDLGVGFVCLLSSGETALYTVSKDLTLERVATWRSRVDIWSNYAGNLVADRCPEASPTDEPGYCVLGNEPQAQRLVVPNATFAERVVALRNGGAAVVVPPRSGKAGSLRLAAPSEGDLVPGRAVALRFEKETPEKLVTLAETGLWLRDAAETREGKLGFWLASANRIVGVAVDLDGTVSLSRRTEADSRRTHVSGPRAFELSAGETAWQSLDFGQSWHEVSVPRGLTSASTRETHDVVGCTTVGCSFGNWLRVGFEPAQSAVPTEAPQPTKLEFRAGAYSQWSLTCYPTGINEAGTRGSAATTFNAGQGRPRYGTNVGFSSPSLGSTAVADVASSANRPFLGVARPTAPAGSFAFDMGADGTHQFRAYAWGRDGEAWRNSSTWLTRVADRFSVAGLWSTAPTRGPWPNLLSAAQLFGADRANRYSSSWQLSLDPGERAGVLRITTTGTTELHFIEEGGATTSIANTSFGPISGVVRVQKAWYFGTQEGNRFHIHQVRNGNVEPFADLPIGDPVAPLLTRNTHGTGLALVLRAPAGTWHIYPLTENGEAREPIVLTRETLNAEWGRCDDEQLGYYVLGSLPLSRFTPNDGSEVLTFEAVPSEWKAEAVTARTIVSSTSRCVEALAARLASNEEVLSLASSPPPKSGSVPLTITDRLNDVRYGFQCLP